MSARAPHDFSDSFEHDLTRDVSGTVECFICCHSVSKHSAYRFEERWHPPLYCHGDCLKTVPGEKVIARYHAKVDEVLRDAGVKPS